MIAAKFPTYGLQASSFLKYTVTVLKKLGLLSPYVYAHLLDYWEYDLVCI